ncbi:MAG: hypothetical protein WEB00_14005 [Dehalococcoidia bacterium]
MLGHLVYMALKIAWIFILALVGARFLLLLVGAEASSDLVDFVYNKSDFWVKPFFGVLDGTKVGDDGQIEWASIIAFVLYYAVGYFVLGLIRGEGRFSRSHGLI